MLKNIVHTVRQFALGLLLMASHTVLAEPLPEYTIRAIFPGNTPHHLDTVCRKNVDKREPH